MTINECRTQWTQFFYIIVQVGQISSSAGDHSNSKRTTILSGHDDQQSCRSTSTKEDTPGSTQSDHSWLQPMIQRFQGSGSISNGHQLNSNSQPNCNQSSREYSVPTTSTSAHSSSEWSPPLSKVASPNGSSQHGSTVSTKQNATGIYLLLTFTFKMLMPVSYNFFVKMDFLWTTLQAQLEFFPKYS